MALPDPHTAQAAGPSRYTIKVITPQDREEAIQKARVDIAASALSAEAHFDLAFALSSTDRLDEATAEFKEALRLDPNHVEAHIDLGIILNDAGDAEAAIGEWTTAIRLSPENDDAHLFLGNALSERGQIQEARTEWAKVIEINKKRFPLYTWAEISQILNVREATQKLNNPSTPGDG